ncbi:hypothetical protein D3C78_1714970 [compost metagenome]
MGRWVELAPQAFHQQLIGHLHQGADHGGRIAAGDGFLYHRAVDLGGGQRVDAEARHQQEDVGRIGRLPQLARLAPVPGEHHVEKQQAAQVMDGAHGVTPDANRPQQQ